jgi:preprotein translocase subunit SecG
VIVIVVISLIVVVLVLRRHKRRHSGHQLGTKSAHEGSRSTGRLHHRSTKAKLGHRRGARA